jgi:hypothetical protein
LVSRHVVEGTRNAKEQFVATLCAKNNPPLGPGTGDLWPSGISGQTGKVSSTPFSSRTYIVPHFNVCQCQTISTIAVFLRFRCRITSTRDHSHGPARFNAEHWELGGDITTPTIWHIGRPRRYGRFGHLKCAIPVQRHPLEPTRSVSIQVVREAAGTFSESERCTKYSEYR